ncbi:MAG: S-layer homology domain-containing protein, partial [Lysinibacillus sp.]
TSSTDNTSSTSGTSSTGTPSKEETQVDTPPNVPIQPEVKVEQQGNTYTAVVSIPAEADKEKSITITISENISVKVPQMAIPTTDGGSSIAISFDVSEDDQIQFKASLNDEPVKFATYVELEIANLAEDAVILRVDENGEVMATPFIIRDGKHVVKTMTPGDFVVSTETITFSDVQKDGHKEYIEALAKRHIVKGVNEESFNPNVGISRAQFAVMIARALNLEPEKETKFKDVKGQWYESAVQALVEAGIINGKNPETFDPSQSLTRQQAALMVTRLLEFAGVELPAVDIEALPFNDLEKVSESARQQVAMVYALGIFTGKADGSFDPSGELTRSQMAKVLFKTLQLAEML